MDNKPRPNHRQYLDVLRALSPEERLLKTFELSEFARALFLHGLKKRHPEASEERFREILLNRLSRCHNRNY